MTPRNGRRSTSRPWWSRPTFAAESSVQRRRCSPAPSPTPRWSLSGVGQPPANGTPNALARLGPPAAERDAERPDAQLFDVPGERPAGAGAAPLDRADEPVPGVERL